MVYKKDGGVVLEISNVSKEYQNKNGNKVEVFKNCSIKFPNKGICAIMGKSGVGKSTLLNIISGMDSVTSGSVFFGKNDITKLNSRELSSYRQTEIGFVHQEYNLIEEIDVYSNVFLAKEICGNTKSDVDIDALLSRLEIEYAKHRKVSELSGGEKQRVAIARALIKKPKIILADEPTGNLDKSTSMSIMKLLKEISRDILVVIVTHNDDVSRIYSDKYLRINSKNIDADLSKGNSTNYNSLSSFKSKSYMPIKTLSKVIINLTKKYRYRLFFSLIIITFMLTIAGLFTTINDYDIQKSSYLTFIANEYDEIPVRYCDEVKTSSSECDFDFWDEQELQMFLSENSELKPSLNIDINIELNKEFTTMINSLDSGNYVDEFTPTYVNGFRVTDDFSSFNIIGEWATENDEILITDYLFVHMYPELDLNDFEDAYIEISNIPYKIKGIVLTNYGDYIDLANYPLLGSDVEESKMIRERLLHFKYDQNLIYSRIFITTQGYNNYLLMSTLSIGLDHQSVELPIAEYQITNDLDLEYQIIENPSVLEGIYIDLNTFNALLGSNYTSQDIFENSENVFDENFIELYASFYNSRLMSTDYFLLRYQIAGVIIFQEPETGKSWGDNSDIQYLVNLSDALYIGLMQQLANTDSVVYSIDTYQISSVASSDINSKFRHDTFVSSALYQLDYISYKAADYLIFASIVFILVSVIITGVVFSSILNSTKKLIWILVSMGLSRAKVFLTYLIMISEVAILSVIFSIIGLSLLIRQVNQSVVKEIDVNIVSFTLSYQVFLIILGLVLMCVGLTVVLPGIKITKMKPYEYIRNEN